MSYAIVGFGAVGQALAHAFARKNIEVAVASRRPPEAHAPQARAIGPTVVPNALQDAIKADTIMPCSCRRCSNGFTIDRELERAVTPVWQLNIATCTEP
jgi:glycerol-3-phosphate dehydrogenase